MAAYKVEALPRRKPGGASSSAKVTVSYTARKSCLKLAASWHAFCILRLCSSLVQLGIRIRWQICHRRVLCQARAGRSAKRSHAANPRPQTTPPGNGDEGGSRAGSPSRLPSSRPAAALVLAEGVTSCPFEGGNPRFATHARHKTARYLDKHEIMRARGEVLGGQGSRGLDTHGAAWLTKSHLCDIPAAILAAGDVWILGG